MSEPTTVAEEWKRGWGIALASAMGLSFLSVVFGGMGAFIDPMTQEFGWSRSTMSVGMPIAGSVILLLSPFAGALVDRFGPRRLALPGVVIMAFSAASFGLTNGSILQWSLLWVVYAFAYLSMQMSIWTGAISAAFNKGRGLALGMMLGGSGVAQAILPILNVWLISNFGWRNAYFYLGFGWGGVTLLLCWLFFHDSRKPSRAKKKAAVNDRLDGLTIRQAWRDRGLWQVAIATVLMMTLTQGLAFHQIPIMTDAGFGRENAAWLAGVAGLAGIAGNIVTGALMDRWRANWVGGLTLGTMTLAFGLLLEEIRTPMLIVVAMMINGYAAGTKLQICSYMTSRYAGLRSFGAIFGFMGSLVAIGGALGPWLAGAAYDFSGDYNSFLFVGMVGSLISGLLVLTLPRCPEWKLPSAEDSLDDLAALPEGGVKDGMPA
jgi:MFS family permease